MSASTRAREKDAFVFAFLSLFFFWSLQEAAFELHFPEGTAARRRRCVWGALVAWRREGDRPPGSERRERASGSNVED